MKPNPKQNIKAFLLKEIPQHSGDIVSFAAQKLSVSRMTIHRYLKKLIEGNEIIQTGKQKGMRYFLKNSFDKALKFDITPNLSETNIWKKYFEAQFSTFPENILTICDYGFTEIMNNAIDHSEGKRVIIKTELENHCIKIMMIDDGIGIFQKLQNKFHFPNKRESIVALSKGKLTTDPENHSGEGIFFTSRAFDTFSISANGLYYLKNNIENDWTLDDKKIITGTAIVMEISQHSQRTLKSIFNDFTNPDNFKFDKTDVIVKLSQFKEERLISRSQAKRILLGLDKFREVILDFRDVKTVGQGFVDEVFRVFQQKHPEIQIIHKNANDNVRFMIERGINTAKI